MKTKVSILVWRCVVAASLFLATGCVHRQRVVVVGEPGVVPHEEVVVTEAPPALEEEVIGISPGPEYVWVAGWWEWEGRWVWRSGHWTIGPHPRAHWVPGHWRRHGGSYVWRPGYWR